MIKPLSKSPCRNSVTGTPGCWKRKKIKMQKPLESVYIFLTADIDYRCHTLSTFSSLPCSGPPVMIKRSLSDGLLWSMAPNSTLVIGTCSFSSTVTPVLLINSGGCRSSRMRIRNFWFGRTLPSGSDRSKVKETVPDGSENLCEYWRRPWLRSSWMKKLLGDPACNSEKNNHIQSLNIRKPSSKSFIE